VRWAEAVACAANSVLDVRVCALGVVRSVQAWSIGRKELQLCAWDVGSSSAVLKQRLNCAHAVRCITQADDLLYLGGGTSISIVNLRGEVRLREATPTGAAGGGSLTGADRTTHIDRLRLRLRSACSRCSSSILT
jgi:hypothetical protein